MAGWCTPHTLQPRTPPGRSPSLQKEGLPMARRRWPRLSNTSAITLVQTRCRGKGSAPPQQRHSNCCGVAQAGAVPCRTTASATARTAGPPISGAACRSRHATMKTSDPK